MSTMSVSQSISRDR